MTHPLLAIDNLSIAFRQQGETQTVVHNLSLEVAVGETLALVGESGSGKSISALSVLRLLPTPPASYPSGDIRFHGQSLLHADEATLRGVRGNRIAMIFRSRWYRSIPCTPWKNSSTRCCRYTGECANRRRAGDPRLPGARRDPSGAAAAGGLSASALRR